MPCCAIITCRLRSEKVSVEKGGISFHRFPTTPNIKEKWINATGRKDQWFPTKTSCICSKHFSEDDFLKMHNKRLLKSSAVPHIDICLQVTLGDNNGSNDNNMIQEPLQVDEESIESSHAQNRRLEKKFTKVQEKSNSPCSSNDSAQRERNLQDILNYKDSVIKQQRNRITKLLAQNRRLKKHTKVQLSQDVSPTPEQLESVSLDRKEVFLVHQRLAHAQNTISSLLIENEELRSKIDGLEKRNEELQKIFVKVNADHRKMVSKTKWSSNSGKEATCKSPKRKKARVSSTEDQDEKDSLLIPRGNATETDGSDTDISDDGDTDDDDKDNICSSPLAQTPSPSSQDMPSTSSVGERMPSTSSAVEQMRTTSSAVEQIPSTSTQLPLAYPFGQTQTQNYPSLIIMPMVTNNEVPIVSSVNSASLNLPLASPFNTVISTTRNTNLAEDPIQINIKEEIKEEPDTSDNNLAELIEVNIKEEIKEEPDDDFDQYIVVVGGHKVKK